MDMKTFFKTLFMTLSGLFLFGTLASAHVSVTPKTSATGAWETYTVKVPVEKNTATTKFTLKMPAGVDFMSYQPVVGWNLLTQKDEKGKVKSITFEAVGEGILPGQFQQFAFVAKNPDHAGDAAWDAYQYYKDGTIVEWTGSEKEKTPHAVTNIVKADASSSDHHAVNASASTSDHQTASTVAKKEVIKANKQHNTLSSNLPLPLSIVAVLLALFSLVLNMRKRA
jgi:uncharacterized protein YcnI